MIQITDDPSAERTAPPRSTHVRSGDVSSFLIQQGVFIFLCVIRRHFRWVRADSGGTFFSRNTVARPMGPSSQGETFFREIRWPIQWVPAVRWRNHYFPRNKEALPCCGCGPSCQPLHVQSTSDGSRSLTTLTTPRREHQGGGRRRGLGRG